MREITIVTGPLRSGTSCLTGFLELCGFDLGRNIRVLRDPTPMNPKGHFELDLLFTINERLLLEAGGKEGCLTPPSPPEIMALAAARERYFRLFIRKFDGELCKDPLFCLTLAAWRRQWPELRRAVFSLRHPLKVASSMQRRYGLSLAEGVALWHTYCANFLAASTGLDFYVLDFDRFRREPLPQLAALLQWLGRPMTFAVLQPRLNDFFLPPSGDQEVDAEGWRQVPGEVKGLYQELLARAND